MRIYEVVDEQLLKETKRVSGFVQRWTGLTNFDLCRILICMSIFFWGIGLAGIISIALIWVYSYRIEKTIHPQFGNALRIDDAVRSARSALVFGAPVFIILAFAYEHFGQVRVEERGFAMSSGPVLLMNIAILYLISVEPDPPSDSKIRKGLRSLRRLLQPNPLPVPT